MRTINKPCPPTAPGKNDTNPYPETTSQSYTIKVITPLFGGGVEAGINDPVTLIRPSSIRGHLRFWWRATRGASCSSVAELRQREGEIWGTAENPSPVSIQVNQPTSHASRQPGNPSPYGFSRYGPEAYVLFSAEQSISREDFSFSLTLRWLNQKQLQTLRDQENDRRRKAEKKLLPRTIQDISLDVEAALWGWVNFGGIGARTRRGCGALYCEELAPPSAETINNWLKTKAQNYGFPLSGNSSTNYRDWPTFPKTLCLKNVAGEAMEGWHEAILWLKQFRQGRDYGRDPGTGKKLGRSRWPEPESIRELICQQRGLNPRPREMRTLDADIPTEYFPRAEFGLPIIFEIKDEYVPDDQGKRKENLKPKLQYSSKIDRMASPLLFRPLCFKDGSTVAMVAVLNTRPLESAYLKKGKHDLTEGIAIIEAHIRNPRLNAYPDTPLKDRSAYGSALEAFIAFIKEREQGFEEYPL